MKSQLRKDLNPRVGDWITWGTCTFAYRLTEIVDDVSEQHRYAGELEHIVGGMCLYTMAGYRDIRTGGVMNATSSQQMLIPLQDVTVVIWNDEDCVRQDENPADGEAGGVLSFQIGGEHYKQQGIQPVEYIVANNLTFLEGNVIKYTTRHRAKGKADDIRKVIHYAQMILELEYGEKS